MLPNALVLCSKCNALFVMILYLASLPKRRVEYEDKNKSLIHSLSSAEVILVLPCVPFVISVIQEAKPNSQHIVRLHEPIAKEVVAMHL